MLEQTDNWRITQLSNRNYLSPIGFKFIVTKVPKADFFSNSASIPGINLGFAQQPTYLRDIPVPGDKLSYEDFTLRFFVDENLENYREIHGWMTGLGFPKDYKQFRDVARSGQDRFPTTNEDAGGLYSDATLFILTSKNNPNIEIRFSDIYPISLSGLDYNQQESDINYLTANVTFAYKIYEFARGNQILDTFTGDGATRSFVLSNAPENPNSLLVKLDNVEKKLNKDYRVFGNTIEFTKAPPGSTAITVTLSSNTTISVVS